MLQLLILYFLADVIDHSVHEAYPNAIALVINQPNLLLLIHWFIAWTLRPEINTDASSNISDLPESSLPPFDDKISIYHSAVAEIYARSDICGLKGMQRECIHASSSWQKGAPRYNTIFVETDPDSPGMLGIDVDQACVFFSFDYNNTEYHCALVDWFSHVGHRPDKDTGMWVVHRHHNFNQHQISEVIDIDTVIHCSHL